MSRMDANNWPYLVLRGALDAQRSARLGLRSVTLTACESGTVIEPRDPHGDRAADQAGTPPAGIHSPSSANAVADCASFRRDSWFLPDLEEGFDGLDRLPLYLALVALDQRFPFPRPCLPWRG